MIEIPKCGSDTAPDLVEVNVVIHKFIREGNSERWV